MMMVPPPMLCIFLASLAATPLGSTALSHPPGLSGRVALAVGTLRADTSRRRRRCHRHTAADADADADADDAHLPTPPTSLGKKLLSLVLQSSPSSNESNDDGDEKLRLLLVKNEIAKLEASFLNIHSGNNATSTSTASTASSNILKYDNNNNGQSSSSSSSSSPLSRFQPLLGLYEVTSVITSNNPKDNPVGGKWTRSNGIAQKLFRTRATFQHLLPYNTTSLSSVALPMSSSSSSSVPVAEAVNVVSLDALSGKFRVTIVLRGDAVPLSRERNAMYQVATNFTTIPTTTTTITTTTTSTSPIQLSDLAVRAYFDPPRIYFGKRRRRQQRRRCNHLKHGDGSNNEYSYFPLQLGPASSVILDTTYYDSDVRIGMGGTSGTRFVFAATNKEEASEYEELLKIPYTNKYKVAGMLGLILVASTSAAFPDALGRHCTSRIMAIGKGKVPLAVSMAWRSRPWMLIMGNLFRLAGGTISVLSAMALLAILFSSGGIERERRT